MVIGIAPCRLIGGCSRCGPVAPLASQRARRGQWNKLRGHRNFVLEAAVSGRGVRIFRTPAAIKTGARRRRGAPAARPRGAQAENLGGTRHFSIEAPAALARVRVPLVRPHGRAACEKRHGNNMGPHGFGVIHMALRLIPLSAIRAAAAQLQGLHAGVRHVQPESNGCWLGAGAATDTRSQGRPSIPAVGAHVSAASRWASSLASGV